MRRKRSAIPHRQLRLQTVVEQLRVPCWTLLDGFFETRQRQMLQLLNIEAGDRYELIVSEAVNQVGLFYRGRGFRKTIMFSPRGIGSVRYRLIWRPRRHDETSIEIEEVPA